MVLICNYFIMSPCYWYSVNDFSLAFFVSGSRYSGFLDSSRTNTANGVRPEISLEKGKFIENYSRIS